MPRHRWLTLIGLAVSAIVACDSLPPDPQPPKQSGLTSVERRSAETVARAVAGAAVAAVPIVDLQGVLEGTLGQPNCPRLLIEPQSMAIPIGLQYLDACSPNGFPTMAYDGNIEGTAFITDRLFDLRTQGLNAGLLRMVGTIAGAHNATSSTPELRVTLNLSLPDGPILRGQAKVMVDRARSTVTVVDAEIQYGSPGTNPLRVTLADVALDASEGGVFQPRTGSAQITVAGSDGTATTHGITFPLSLE